MLLRTLFGLLLVLFCWRRFSFSRFESAEEFAYISWHSGICGVSSSSVRVTEVSVSVQCMSLLLMECGGTGFITTEICGWTEAESSPCGNKVLCWHGGHQDANVGD